MLWRVIPAIQLGPCGPGASRIGGSLTPFLSHSSLSLMLSLSSHDLWARPYDTLLGEEKPELLRSLTYCWILKTEQEFLGSP